MRQWNYLSKSVGSSGVQAQPDPTELPVAKIALQTWSQFEAKRSPFYMLNSSVLGFRLSQDQGDEPSFWGMKPPTGLG